MPPNPKYPSYDLRESVRRAIGLYQTFDRGGFKRASAAEAWGYSVNSYAPRALMASLGYYGLIDGYGTYSLTDRAFAIITNDEGSAAHRRALRDAALTPVVFRAMHEAFPGGTEERMLRGYLIREQGFSQEGAAQCAKAWIQTRDFARINAEAVLDSDQRDQDRVPEDEVVPEGVSASPLASPGFRMEIGVGKVVIFPPSLTEKEWDMVETMLMAWRSNNTVDGDDHSDHHQEGPPLLKEGQA